MNELNRIFVGFCFILLCWAFLSLSIGSLNFLFLVFFFFFCLREKEKVVVCVGGENLRGAGVGEKYDQNELYEKFS